jgi:hypothetical protein
MWLPPQVPSAIRDIRSRQGRSGIITGRGLIPATCPANEQVCTDDDGHEWCCPKNGVCGTNTSRCMGEKPPHRRSHRDRPSSSER